MFFYNLPLNKNVLLNLETFVHTSLAQQDQRSTGSGKVVIPGADIRVLSETILCYFEQERPPVLDLPLK